MPIYEYRCSKCGETFEIIQKISDPLLKKHKGCGGSLTKLISAAGFQFKGTGWYVTDYARKGKPGGESEKSESSKKTDTSKDSSTSSSKPKKSSDS
jgi:putative FmdB family regulatory protein